MIIQYILGISGGKDSAALLIGNPSVTSRRSVGGFISSILLHGFYEPTLLSDAFYTNCVSSG